VRSAGSRSGQAREAGKAELFETCQGTGDFGRDATLARDSRLPPLPASFPSILSSLFPLARRRVFCQAWWYTPVVLATWEAEEGKWQFKVSLSHFQMECEILSEKQITKAKRLGRDSGMKHLLNLSSISKTEKKKKKRIF
jgi:hypothetical protein